MRFLLADKTTGENIIWATNTYERYGDGYRQDNQITPELISGVYANLIQPRVLKAAEEQVARTKAKAEVMTPDWVCNLQNNLADDQWFGCSNVFNTQTGHLWIPTEKPIPFNKKSGWKKYVDSKRIEIACGEAPYLVSRYDTTTGLEIQVKNRIGILDRKLRVVNENTDNEADWLKWVQRAFESTYGYEYQGDNLLVARINLLLTFVDYMQERWQREPTVNELNKIANVICWNIWQMDGLKGTIPGKELYISDDYEQLSLFATDFEQETLFNEVARRTKEYECKIRNWRAKKSVAYNTVKEEKSDMKFDFVNLNPPYQQEMAQHQTENGQKAQTNIFQYFQMEADKIASEGSVLIYPAGRWIHQSGKGMKDFGLKQINDKHLARVIMYPNSKEVFSSAAIADGVSIVQKNMKKETNGFEYTYIVGGNETTVHVDNPGTDLMPLNPKDFFVLSKVDDYVKNNGIGYMHSSILPRTFFGIESDFVEKNPTKVRKFASDSDMDFKKEIKLFTNDKAGKAGRATWFVADKSVVPNNANRIGEWQVVVSSANAGGQKRDNQLEIIDNHSVFGRSRVAIKSFKTEKEAQNFYHYMKTYLVRYTFLMTDEALTSLGKRVPDFGSYADGKIFDYSKPLDEQLFKAFNLTDEEIAYVKERVDGVRK